MIIKTERETFTQDIQKRVEVVNKILDGQCDQVFF